MMKTVFVIIVSRRDYFEDQYQEIESKTLDHYPSDDEIKEELIAYNGQGFVEYARVEKRHEFILTEG